MAVSQPQPFLSCISPADQAFAARKCSLLRGSVSSSPSLPPLSLDCVPLADLDLHPTEPTSGLPDRGLGDSDLVPNKVAFVS